MLIARLRFRLGAFHYVCRCSARCGYLCFCKIHSDPSLPVLRGGGAACGAWSGGIADRAARTTAVVLSIPREILVL
jgi:hypothetical protein